MADLKDLKDRFSSLKIMLGIGNRRQVIAPPDVIDRAIEIMEELQALLAPYTEMTNEQKRQARSNPISLQIQSLRTRNKRSENFFDINYLVQMFDSLPEDRKLVWKKRPRSKTDALKALIYYNYHKSKNDNFNSLKDLRDKLESDFNSDPESKRLEQLNSIYRDLLKISDQTKVVEKLKELFTTEDEARLFARDVGLKVPKTGGGSFYERLARKIKERRGAPNC